MQKEERKKEKNGSIYFKNINSHLTHLKVDRNTTNHKLILKSFPFFITLHYVISITFH